MAPEELRALHAQLEYEKLEGIGPATIRDRPTTVESQLDTLRFEKLAQGFATLLAADENRVFAVGITKANPDIQMMVATNNVPSEQDERFVNDLIQMMKVTRDNRMRPCIDFAERASARPDDIFSHASQVKPHH